MHTRGEFFPAGRPKDEKQMRRGEDPVARRAGGFNFQPGPSRLPGQRFGRDQPKVSGIVIKVQREIADGLSPQARQLERFGMGRFKINPTAQLEQSRDLAQQQFESVEMFDEVHAGNCVHRTIWPRQ